jgi:2-methylcitrate dehydratase PrpD
MEKSIVERLAEFVVSTCYEFLPENVIHKTKLCILDFLGVALAGSDIGLSPLITDVMCKMGGRKESTIMGDKRKIPALNAALVNGVRGHTLDMDDGHKFASGHPGVAIIPAAIAIAEKENATGEQLIESIVVGYETFLCIGKALNHPSLAKEGVAATGPAHAMKGFFTTGTVGPFGAATACAKMLGLNKVEVENALSLAGLQGAGLQEATVSGQMGKHLQAGRASQAGVMASLLAKNGAEGPGLIFEGEKGFFKAFSDTSNVKEVLLGLGKNFEIMNTYFKLHATCRGTHVSIDAAQEICRQECLGPRDIKEIIVETFPYAFHLCGDIVHPETILAAKFSIPFSVAMAISLGDLFVDKFTEENLNNAEIKELASKVKVSIGKQWVKAYPGKRGSSVTIRTYAGQSYSYSLSSAKGAPEAENPLDSEDVVEKFKINSTHVISEQRSNKLRENILDLENLSINEIREFFY